MFTVGKDASIENQPGQGTGMRSSAGIRGNTAQAGPEWAGLEGVACTVEAGEGTFCVSGELGGHPWRVERAPASRDYLVGEELRGRAFFHRYAILAERRADAMAWLTPELVELLMGWPEPAPDNTVPFILMLMRGKAHLRMQALPHAAVADLPAQIHAVRLLVNASGVAVAAFPDVAPGSVKK
ncbi:MAG: hypothetical protein B7X59_04345 [Polaromonas sp. 39-63-203]|nr:MAG: hypothetical protein B7X59_04345 [Polaromonas sp. 39-63-203]